jgi:4-carboxymuconolactone decarboxylase
MIVEGYGKILSRPGLELRLRELCIVAACVATGQDRQLHSHLHGALNAGATGEEVAGTLGALEGIVDIDALERGELLLGRVLGK